METIDDYCDHKFIPKPKEDWTDVEEQGSLGNSRALNAIYNGRSERIQINQLQYYSKRCLESP